MIILDFKTRSDFRIVTLPLEFLIFLTFIIPSIVIILKPLLSLFTINPDW